MSQIKTGTIDFEDGRMYYEAADEGAPLVFLHAVFDSRMWDDQWDEFSQHHSVIRFDTRGFGRSDPPKGPVSRRQELYRLLEEIGLRRAILVGCSMGGETVLDVALERPEFVSGMVLVSAVPGGFEIQGEPPKELMEMLAAMEQCNLDLVSELQVRIWFDGPFRQLEEVDERVRQRAVEMSRSELAKGMQALTLALAPPPDPLDPPAAMRLDQIKAPTLIIAGEMDNPEILRAAEVMAGAIPGAQKIILPGCAHLPNIEKPAEFNRSVRHFLHSAGRNEMKIQVNGHNSTVRPGP